MEPSIYKKVNKQNTIQNIILNVAQSNKIQSNKKLSKPIVNEQPTHRKNSGFTLVELVIVIVLLGILSVGISGFLSMGSQIFVDVKNRSEIIATARFVIERLNRELRTALPNSVHTTLVDASNIDTGIQCIEYIPILTSANYLDIPTQSDNEFRTTLSVISFDAQLLENLSYFQVVVYPSSSAEIQTRTRILNSATIDDTTHVDINNNQWDINFTNPVQFPIDSPTSRLYFVKNKVSYCVKADELKRFVGDNPNDQSNASSANSFFLGNNGVLMAEDLFYTPSNFTGIDVPFTLLHATQYRNSTALIKLIFKKNEEVVVFNSEVHVPNAP